MKTELLLWTVSTYDHISVIMASIIIIMGSEYLLDLNEYGI